MFSGDTYNQPQNICFFAEDSTFYVTIFLFSHLVHFTVIICAQFNLLGTSTIFNYHHLCSFRALLEQRDLLERTVL